MMVHAEAWTFLTLTLLLSFSPALTFQVTSEEALKSLPMYKQGDISLYTHDKLKLRSDLRRNALVADATRRWCAPQSLFYIRNLRRLFMYA